MAKLVDQKELLEEWMKNVVSLLQNIDNNVYNISKHLEVIEAKQVSSIEQQHVRSRSRDHDNVGFNSRESSPNSQFSYNPNSSSVSEADEVNLWWKTLDKLGLNSASARFGIYDTIEKWRIDVRKEISQEIVESILLNATKEYESKGKRLIGKIDIAVARPCTPDQYERRLFRYSWNDETKKFDGSIGSWVKEEKDWLKMTRQMQIEQILMRKARKVREENGYKAKYWQDNTNIYDSYNIVFTNHNCDQAIRKVLKIITIDEYHTEALKWCDMKNKDLMVDYFKIEIGVGYQEGTISKYRTHIKYLDSNTWKVINERTSLDSDVPNVHISNFLNK